MMKQKFRVKAMKFYREKADNIFFENCIARSAKNRRQDAGDTISHSSSQSFSR